MFLLYLFGYIILYHCMLNSKLKVRTINIQKFGLPLE